MAGRSGAGPARPGLDPRDGMAEGYQTEAGVLALGRWPPERGRTAFRRSARARAGAPDFHPPGHPREEAVPRREAALEARCRGIVPFPTGESGRKPAAVGRLSLGSHPALPPSRDRQGRSPFVVRAGGASSRGAGMVWTGRRRAVSRGRRSRIAVRGRVCAGGRGDMEKIGPAAPGDAPRCGCGSGLGGGYGCGTVVRGVLSGDACAPYRGACR